MTAQTNKYNICKILNIQNFEKNININMLAIVGMLSAAKQISWFLPQNTSHTSQSQPKMTPERSTALKKKKKKQDRCDILKDSNRLLTDTDPPAARTQISQNPV